MTIPEYYYVYDSDLQEQWGHKNRKEAEQYARDRALNSEDSHAVMLRVPVSGFPELRAIAVFDYSGRCVWETDVYQPELVA